MSTMNKLLNNNVTQNTIYRGASSLNNLYRVVRVAEHNSGTDLPNLDLDNVSIDTTHRPFDLLCLASGTGPSYKHKQTEKRLLPRSCGLQDTSLTD